MLYTFIIFRHEVITGRIIITLASVLALYIVILSPAPQTGYDVFSLQMLGQELMQVMIGFAAGLILNIAFEVFVVLGQIISTQVGLSHGKHDRSALRYHHQSHPVLCDYCDVDFFTFERPFIYY